MANSAVHPERPSGPGAMWRLVLLAGVALAFRRRQADPCTPGPGRPSARRESIGDKPQENRRAPPSAALEPGRGRQADAPNEIPARGWKDILIRSWKEFGDDQIPLISAGITFYALLALFPALGALVSIYGLFADPAEVPKHLQQLARVLPSDAVGFLKEQLLRIAGAQEGGLSAGFLGGLMLSIWSANGAMKAMLAGLNVAYDEKEDRKFLAKTLTSLAFTCGFIVLALLALTAMAVAPAAGRAFGDAAAWGVGLVAWPLLVVILGLGLAMLYRFGPSRDPVRWRWITWGSAAAVLLWLAFSALFSLYLANFADYNKTYGSLGAVIGFMMWIYFSAQVILLGAELNSEIEHQTVKDTTVGPEKPMGQRDAVMADTIGERQGR